MFFKFALLFVGLLELFILVYSQLNCGFQQADDYIRDTHETVIAEFPWIVRLGYRRPNEDYDEFLCVGSLISRKHVLTAAQCLFDGLELTKIRVSEYHMRNSSDCIFYSDIKASECTSHKDYGMKTFTRHPKFDGRNNDIAVLEMDSEITDFSESLYPICLPPKNLEPQRGLEYIYTSSGWGWKIVPDGDYDPYYEVIPIKQKINIRLVTNQECSSNAVTVGENQLCGRYANKSVCLYDNGGPLMFRTRYLWYQDGIVLTGSKNCIGESPPLIYTSIHEYIPWIEKAMET